MVCAIATGLAPRPTVPPPLWGSANPTIIPDKLRHPPSPALQGRLAEGVAEPRSEQAMKIGYLEDNFENSDFDQNLRFSEG